MKRLLVLCIALAAPLAAGAQGFTLRPPSIGEARLEMERLSERAASRRPRLEQTFVVPERPGQNQVSWYDFDWHHYDIPSPAGGTGSIRLYFYERERAIAELALPSIRTSYLRLVDQFHYSPTKRIPYILYSSQREFLATNVFQVTEGTQGVTSPEDLKMTLPYFGDHEKFRHVSMHELVHQFTIQKLIDLAEAEEGESPIQALPLWFIEGIAEWYSLGGIDAETDAYLRDLVWNPDPREHYEILPFGEDRLRGYIPTYKLGQARIEFIASTYGPEKVQGFLENAVHVGGSGERGFGALVRRTLNEPIEQVDARWRAWLKRRYYPQYLKIRQDLPTLREYRDLPSEPEAFEASPDGALILFRGIDREAGRVRLYLLDNRNPRGAVEVAADNQPGIESLHPIDHGIAAVGQNVLVFAAQTGAGDALYVVPFKHTPPEKGKGPRIQLGKRRRLPLEPPSGGRFIEVSDPALSRDGSHVAFVGLTERGQLDVYVVPTKGGPVRQLTNDPYAKHDLAWGLDGIYCVSDATDHGRFNVFRIDEATGEKTRITTAPNEDRHPRPQADGSVLYSSWADAKSDIWLWKNGTIRRLTDFATGLSAPAAAPNARGVYASTFYRGRFRMVEVPKVALLEDPPVAVGPPVGPALEIPSEKIPTEIPAYNAYSLKNWRPEAGIVYGGGAQNAVAGRAALLFSEMLRDRVVYLDLSVYGSFDYTQAIVLFENRGQRTNVVYGAFHFVQQQIDRLDTNLAYFQRDFGVVASRRYPIDRFRRLEAEVQVGGISRYCLTDFSNNDLPISCGSAGRTTASQIATDAWNRRNLGVSFTLGPTFRYGYDTVRYDALTGPISGNAFMLELGGGWLPWRSAVHGFSRLEAAKHFQISGRANFTLRGGLGTSFAPNDVGRSWSRSWWLTSADNLRGFYPLDLAYLIGSHYYVANAELQVPLDSLIRFFIFDFVEGVAAMDFGGVFNRWEDRHQDIGGQQVVSEPGALTARTLTGVLGVNVLFGPLLLRVHFGHPFDIGGQKTPAQLAGDSWVTNLTLRYFFF